MGKGLQKSGLIHAAFLIEMEGRETKKPPL